MVDDESVLDVEATGIAAAALDDDDGGGDEEGLTRPPREEAGCFDALLVDILELVAVVVVVVALWDPTTRGVDEVKTFVVLLLLLVGFLL